jgi:DNA-directed RNA polymerase subunit RPC12/RpoP
MEQTILVKCPHCGIGDIISVDDEYHTCVECGAEFLTVKFGMPVTVENLLSATGDVAKTAKATNPDANSGFKKFDSEKLKYSSLPVEAIEEVTKVFNYGAAKYGDLNWLANANQVEWTRYMNAADRHWVKFKKNQNFDEESSLYELAHIATNILMLLQYQVLELGIDNRFKIKK